MSLRLIRRDTVPPGGFRFTEEKTGIELSAASFQELVTAVRKHRVANALEVGVLLEDEVEGQICRKAPAGICTREPDSLGAHRPVGSLSLDAVIRGTETLVDWFLHGRQKVSREEARSRAATCSACQYNQKPQGCSACRSGAVTGLVDRIVGGAPVEGEHHLEACVLCGCSLKAKVWLPADVIQRHTPDDLNAKLPDYCPFKKQ